MGQELSKTPKPHSWRPWGDHPLVVAIAFFASIITIYTFYRDNAKGMFDSNQSVNLANNSASNIVISVETVTPNQSNTKDKRIVYRNRNSNEIQGYTNVVPELSKTPKITDAPALKIITDDIVNKRATNLVKPPYTEEAKRIGASGEVKVEVTIDEQGNVILAKAISGHPYFYTSSELAARSSKFTPKIVEGRLVKFEGIIIYNFIP